jgi:hypothetical protein
MTVVAASETFELRSDLASPTYLPTLFGDLTTAENYTSMPPTDLLRAVSAIGAAALFAPTLHCWTSPPAGTAATSPASGEDDYLGRGSAFFGLVARGLEQSRPAG